MGHSIITFALKGGSGGPSKCEHMQARGGGVTSMQTSAFKFL